MYHEPLPIDQAVTHLRRRMQMLRFECKIYNVEQWQSHFVMAEDIHPRLIWEPGLDWQSIVDELEEHPISWDEEKEVFYKQLKEHAVEMAKKKGVRVAQNWEKEQLLEYRKRMQRHGTSTIILD